MRCEGDGHHITVSKRGRTDTELRITIVDSRVVEFEILGQRVGIVVDGYIDAGGISARLIDKHRRVDGLASTLVCVGDGTSGGTEASLIVELHQIERWCIELKTAD